MLVGARPLPRVLPGRVSNVGEDYEVDALVQLGYNGEGTPILFEPQWEGAKISLPDRGTRIDFEALLAIAPLRVLSKQGGEGGADPFFMH